MAVPTYDASVMSILGLFAQSQEEAEVARETE